MGREAEQGAVPGGAAAFLYPDNGFSCIFYRIGRIAREMAFFSA